LWRRQCWPPRRFCSGISDQGLNVWLPQVIAGLGVITLGLVTKTEPQFEAKAMKVAV
jgi:hypothetical protein